MSILNLRELSNGQSVTGRHLMVYSASFAKTKSNKKYLMLKLGNSTGTMEARMWSVPENYELPATGSVYAVTAEVNEFAGQLQLNVSTMMPVPSDIIDVADFSIEVDNKPTEDALLETISIIMQTLCEHNATLLHEVFGQITASFFNDIRKHTAACNVHHAGVGGWIKHTIEVCRYAEHIYLALPEHIKPLVRRDLIRIGAFMHDIGKLLSYGFECGVPVMTTSGKLLDHVVEGVLIVQSYANSCINYKPELSTQMHDIYMLNHIIASHHMELEWGSPVNPVTLEAMIICYADQLSASMDTIYTALKERPAGEPWTSKIFTQHNRQFTDTLNSVTIGPKEE